MKIKIKYFSEDYPRLEKINKGDWIDLRIDGLREHTGVRFNHNKGFGRALEQLFETYTCYNHASIGFSSRFQQIELT